MEMGVQNYDTYDIIMAHMILHGLYNYIIISAEILDSLIYRETSTNLHNNWLCL